MRTLQEGRDEVSGGRSGEGGQIRFWEGGWAVGVIEREEKREGGRWGGRKSEGGREIACFRDMPFPDSTLLCAFPHTLRRSRSMLGGTYDCPEGKNERTFLAGSFSGWSLTEVAVFKVECPISLAIFLAILVADGDGALLHQVVLKRTDEVEELPLV